MATKKPTYKAVTLVFGASNWEMIKMTVENADKLIAAFKHKEMPDVVSGSWDDEHVGVRNKYFRGADVMGVIVNDMPPVKK